MKPRNWERQLIEWAGLVVGMPFIWGQTDCCALALQAVAQLHHAPPAVPGYGDARGAQLVLANIGGYAGLARMLQDLGAQRVDVSDLQHGDLVLRAADGDTDQLGVQAYVFVSGRLLGSDRDDGVRWYDVAALLRLMRVADDADQTDTWRLP